MSPTTVIMPRVRLPVWRLALTTALAAGLTIAADSYLADRVALYIQFSSSSGIRTPELERLLDDLRPLLTAYPTILLVLPIVYRCNRRAPV